MTFAQLLAEVEQEYGSISRFAKGLSPEQLDRKAHIPALKESPLGEYPTLEDLIGGLGGYHVQFHVDHMQEILQSLRGAKKWNRLLRPAWHVIKNRSGLDEIG